MSKPSKKTPERVFAALASAIGRHVFPIVNMRLPQANYVQWTHSISRELAAILGHYPNEMATLQALIIGADEAMNILARCANICPYCRGGMGGCNECVFTGCADGHGPLQEPVNVEDLRDRWIQRELQLFQWSAAADVRESLIRSNPKDYPKPPKKGTSNANATKQKTVRTALYGKT